jgi:hypothetical protein
MAQPDYVPIGAEARVREVERLPVARPWYAERPAELRGPPPRGASFGSPGPDAGYGMMLARQFADRVQLEPGEHAADAVAGCFAVGTARAGLLGRAPVVYDMELAYALWGFLNGAPPELVAYRVPLFRGASRHYDNQREIVARVPESTLLLTPADVRTRLGEWRTLLKVD